MTSEWKMSSISEVCSVVTDGSHFSPKSVDDGHYMVSVKDFTHDGFDFTNCRHISEEDYVVLEKNGCVPQIDDILIGKDGARYFEDIVIYRQREKPALLSSIAILRCNEGIILPEFLYYTLRTPSFRSDVRENYGSGSAIPRIILKDFKRMPVSVPPIEVQQAIVDVLSVLDARITENRKINHHLEQMAQAIFKSWFVDFEPFGGVMPDDWRSTTIDELCLTVTKGTTPTTLKKRFVEQGINFVKAESILNDHSIDYGKLAHIDDDTNSLLSRSVIRAGDILFTIAGTLGRFSFVGEDLVPANTNQAVAIIRPDDTKIKPIILYSFFVGGLHTDFYTRNIQQAVQANLSLTTIKSLPLSIPQNGVLNEYSTLVQPLFEAVFQNQAESRRLAALRDTLLPRLMSGELSVADIVAK